MIPINSAIVLAAGKGSRMKAGINKQYLMLQDKPVIYYTLSAFEKCNDIDEIIVVTAPDEVAFFQADIVDKYSFRKVKAVVAGGLERQASAFNGLCAVSNASDIVLIHDGARPFVGQQVIAECIIQAKVHGAAAAGMPSKDTVKLVDEAGIVVSTPARECVWITQTPQAFRYSLIVEAHQAAVKSGILATDDAMLVEIQGKPVKMVTAAYENMKLTTPEDMLVAEQLIKMVDKL